MDAQKIEETPMVHQCCGRVVCDGKDCRNNGPWGKVPAWRMGGYYYDFTHTGLAPIDKILSAVGCAGKAYHHTGSWGEETEFGYEHLRGKSPEAWIENAAADAASAIREVLQTLASKESELVRLRELLAGCRTVFALALDNGKGEQYASLETRRGSFVHCVELMQDLDAAITQPPKEPT